MISLARMVIAHIPIDHLINSGFYITLKWIRSALKGMIQVHVLYALYQQSMDGSKSFHQNALENLSDK